jgi:diphthamide synthase (EF-2-diphthine--ammonia ligase)
VTKTKFLTILVKHKRGGEWETAVLDAPLMLRSEADLSAQLGEWASRWVFAYDPETRLCRTILSDAPPIGGVAATQPRLKALLEYSHDSQARAVPSWANIGGGVVMIGAIQSTDQLRTRRPSRVATRMATRSSPTKAIRP